MSPNGYTQLISYIAPSAPATRRPGVGDEPYLRPEVGFTPKWYHDRLGIDFGQKFHTDVAHRLTCLSQITDTLREHFGDLPIGSNGDTDGPPDLLTGTFGACPVAAIYGIPILYAENNWPNSTHDYLTREQIAKLEPPDLDHNKFFSVLMDQLDKIANENGRIDGFINWQGVLNTALRIRGNEIFTDMALEPERVDHLFECVATTMVDGMKRVYARQKTSDVDVHHATISNCLVNMVSAEHYRRFLLPWDKMIAETFGVIGVHNCAWTADPYIPDYSTIPGLGYIDMGQDSDLVTARQTFGSARRAIMYTPMDVVDKTTDAIKGDLERIANLYGPCDVVFADIETHTPDERVKFLFDTCDKISQ